MDAINIWAPGHWDMCSSYGLIACQLAQHLSALGLHVNAMGRGDTATAGQPDAIRAAVSQPIVPVGGGIVLGYPTAYPKYGALSSLGPRVAITMFESTVLPPTWAYNLNTVERIVVPADWLVDVLRRNGIGTPIEVVPLGVDAAYRPLARERAPDAPYTFLAFADRGPRKGAHEAIQAFLQAFGDDLRVRLVLKSRRREVQADVLNPNIFAVQRDMTVEELYALYASVDCLVFPSKGEGFGLPPREFAATGGLAIATAWGGLRDSIDDWGVPLPYRIGPAWGGHRQFEGQSLGEWAEPDVEALAALMARAAAGELEPARWQGAGHVHELYNWAAFAARVHEIWRDAREAYDYSRSDQRPAV